MTILGSSEAVIGVLPPIASFKTSAQNQLYPLTLMHAPSLVVASASLQALEKVSGIKFPKPHLPKCRLPSLQSLLWSDEAVLQKRVFRGKSKKKSGN